MSRRRLRCPRKSNPAKNRSGLWVRWRGDFDYPGVVCSPAHLPHQHQQGIGFYDNIFTTRNADTFHPAVNPRTVLASDHTPVLIMTGSCNYIKWAIEWQYRMKFPDSRLLYFANAGQGMGLEYPGVRENLSEPLPSWRDLQMWGTRVRSK